MKLSIVIPAYNEEQAIAAIIERTLAAREHITARSPVTAVEVVVVSDGSTDRTVEIASRYGDVHLIVLDRNRGYGAAIKQGFEESSGDLVGFLDADGTCDPCFFATLCTAVAREDATVAIGSRMGPQSRMPRLRRIGNRGYALILSALSNRVVTDTASGMRVIRRDALPQLYPLPDGLHFTPAMSARVLMDHRLTIVEQPMPYEERIGESKLHVLRDGVRFLRTILHMSLMWQPARFCLAASVLCFAMFLLLSAAPLETWWSTGRLPEEAIYRLLFCSFLGACGSTLLSASVLCECLHQRWDDRARPRTFVTATLARLHTLGGLIAASIPCVSILVWLVGPGLWSRITEGVVRQHWSRAVLAGLIAFAFLQMTVTVGLTNLIRFHTTRKSHIASIGSQKSVPASVVTPAGPVGRLADGLDYQPLPCQ